MASQDFTAAQVLTAAQMDKLVGAVDGYTTTATAAGTTVLTTDSNYQQVFTGSTTQTVTLPVTSTLGLGQRFKIINDSSGIVTVQSSGANTVYAVPAGVTAEFICILLTGTTAASWLADYPAAASTPGVTLIEQKTIASAVSSYTFSSIPGTYRNLRLVFSIRQSDAATDATFGLRLNGDSGSNYDHQAARVTVGGLNAAETLATSLIVIGQYATANTAPAGAAYGGDIVIPDYAGTTFQKTINTRGTGRTTAASGGIYNDNTKGNWRNTAAITSITLLDVSGGNLMIGSSMTLYGEI